MEYTEQQLAEFRRQFAARQGRQRYLAVPLGALLVLLYFSSDKDAGTVFGQSLTIVAPLFAAVLIGTAVFSWWNWRCPACDRYLGRSATKKTCGKCGVVLEKS